MMENWSRRFKGCVVFAVAAVMAVITVIAYLQHPLFGYRPAGERLSRLTQSPNFDGGIFHNQIDSPLRTSDQSTFSIVVENLLDETSHRRPPSAIPAIKTDLKTLDAQQDLVIWLGHSSYFVQLGGQRILIDPVFSINAAPIPLANVAFDGTSLYTADDMPEIDFLLITHDHYDHLDYPSVLALQPKVKHVVVGLGVGAHFEGWGYDMRTVHEADWYATLQPLPPLQIHVTPARHYSGRSFARDQSLWVGFALVSLQRRIFFSGDSGFALHFAAVGRRYGPFDWVTLDAGQYDPRWANVHMNPEQAAQAAEALRARALTPGHAGRFALSSHDWNAPFKRIRSASQGRSYALWTPEIGRPIHLDGRAQTFSAWWETVQ